MSKFKKGDKVQVVALPSVNIGGMTTDIVGCYGLVEEVRSGINPYTVFLVGFDGRFWNFSEECLQIALFNNSEGVKYDSDKLEYSLLPKGVLNKVVNVLGFGSKKYAKDNWMKVDNPKERYYNAAQRHINQWWEGEKYDSETGENHLAHAICCLMFMLWFDNQEDKEVNK